MSKTQNPAQFRLCLATVYRSHSASNEILIQICVKGLVLINLSSFPPCRRVYTADQSMRSSKIIPDMEGSLPEGTLSVPDPSGLTRSTDSGKQMKGLF